MTEQDVLRKLTTIFCADIVGYSRLTGNDEVGTHHSVMEVLDLARDTIQQQGGTVLRYAGDAILAEFSSVVACVDAAVAVQTELGRRNEEIAKDSQVLLRIGINLGEVLEDRGEIYGDGVNIAARLEGLAPPGGVCVTGQVAEQIAGKMGEAFAYAGRHSLKNINHSVEVWCWPAEKARKIRRAASSTARTVLLGVVAFIAMVAAFYLFSVKDESSLPTGPRDRKRVV